MYINEDISRRITILRFPLVFGVLVCHSAHYRLIINGSHYNLIEPSSWRGSGISPTVVFLENLLSHVVGSIPVPFFFLIAGLLFFKDFDLSQACIKIKLKKRINSLFVPYVIWNTIMFLGILAVQMLKPDLAAYFNPDRVPIADYDIMDFLNGYLGLRDDYIYDGPLWFVRDLMLLLLCVPFSG